MQRDVVCQGRRLNGSQIVWLRDWIALHPQWSRKRLSRELCQQWDWRNARGRLKDFAARSFLENLKYLVQDRHGRDLACLLFGAAAWRAAARDKFLGWDESQKAVGLSRVANNTRFLVLPWVKVRGLASHVLSRLAGRLSEDWQ